MHRRTRQFRDLLQENIQEILGQDVPLEVCWALYKVVVATNLQFLIGMVDVEKLEDVKLPLRGIGTWRIDFRKPRDIAGKQSRLVGKTDWVPFFRFTPSTRFRRVLLKKFCGIEEPIPISVKRKQERLTEG